METASNRALTGGVARTFDSAKTDPVLEFRILGPLEVRDGERLVELPRPKQRALLAILLLRAGEVVSSDALVDGLWGEQPPRTSKAALQNSVSQLRRALGPDVVGSHAGGYLLDVAPEQVDVRRFEALAAEGRAAVGAERAEKLRDALELWRGPPLADLVFEPFAAVEVVRLEELRTAALEDLIDAELALGAGTELVAGLENLIAENPFRERLRGQLMLALFRAGRQADALQAYQETRRTLVEELGIEPSAPLRELEQAILRQDESLAPPPPEPEMPREERRKTVTVLFADLTFAEALDPELVRSTTMDALARVRRVLEQHEATFEQRAGDEVMGVFGVPLAHEDDPLRAARAALDAEAEVARLAGKLESEGRGRIELRVGIETGEVLAGADAAGHGFIAGTAITLAKRLQQAARADEVVVGDAIRALLGEAVVTEPTGDGPDRGHRIVELVEGVPALPRHLETPLADRQAELAAVCEAYERAVGDQECRVLLILGEAGIGKTRLVREVTEELGDAASVLVGRCVSYGKGATYLPVAEIIRQARAEFDLPTLLAAVDNGDEIARKLAELAGEEEGAGSGGEEFWAFRRFLEAVAAKRPLVIAFEDLHWAEPTLLDLVEYLPKQAGKAAILVLAIARPDLLEERPAWRQDEAVTLAPLPEDDCVALVDDLAEVPPDLRARVVGTSGGNPLFVEQLLAYAKEDVELETIPPSLESLLASRLDRLDPSELSVLQRAAVAGREFSPQAVAHLSPEREAESIGGDLSALVRLGLLRPGPSTLAPEEAFRFHHALIRDAAYNSIPKKLRSELHERAADWLELEGTGQDELVGYHLEQAFRLRVDAGAHDAHARRLAAKAGTTLAAAGLRAWRRADAAAAVNLLGRAAELLPRDPLRLELLCELGLALRTTGEITHACDVLERTAEQAAAEGDRRIELRARLELANARLSSDPDGSAAELLELASSAIPTFEALGDDRSLGRAWLLSGYVRGGLHCQNAEWREAAEHALVHYERSGWPTAACFGEIASSLYYGPTPVSEAVRRCGVLLAEVSDRGGEAHVLVWLGGLHAFGGQLDLARDLVERARTIFEELGYRMAVAYGCRAVLAEIELLADRPSAAEESLRKGCEALEAMHEEAFLASRAAELAEAIYRQSRYDDAETWVSVAEEHAPADDIGAHFLASAVRAKILARRELFAEAETLAREALALAEQTDSLNYRAKGWIDLADVLRLASKLNEAATSIRSGLDCLERKGNIAAAERARALLDDEASAEPKRR
jgi:DNA-binding SARP family transcriptional activator